MRRCLDPCDSEDWNCVNYSTWRKLHNKTVQEFCIASHRLVCREYTSTDNDTHMWHKTCWQGIILLHVGCRILHVTLSSSKPATLAAAINLTAELELRGLRNGHLAQDSNVVVEQKSKRDEQLEVLLGVVEWRAVQCRKLEPMHFASIPTVV